MNKTVAKKSGKNIKYNRKQEIPIYTEQLDAPYVGAFPMPRQPKSTTSKKGKSVP